MGGRALFVDGCLAIQQYSEELFYRLYEKLFPEWGVYFAMHPVTVGSATKGFGDYLAGVNGFPKGAKTYKRGTYVIKLGENRVDRSVRKNLVRGKAFSVSPIAPDRMNEYHVLLRKTRERLGLRMPPIYATANEDEHVSAFMVEHNGRMVAAQTVIRYNGIVCEAGLAREPVEPDVVGDVLKCGVIDWVTSKGDRLYDLGGCSLNPNDPIARFKKKFGGELVVWQGWRWRKPWRIL